jgi:uncharacterized protein (DUF2141 family)
MLKMRILFLTGLAMATTPVAVADAAVLGPDSAQCVAGKGPAILVKILGLRNRGGKVRARTFLGSSPSTWFDKKQTLLRTEAETPGAGPVEICMPVPKAGGYVVDVRHDINNNGDTDRADGVGASGNPTMTMWDILLGRKPPASQVVFQVGTGVTAVTVTLKYASGGSAQGGMQ